MSAQKTDEKTAVVLMQYGGPDSQEAVEPFLFNLFNDPNIIEAPTPIRWMIAKWVSKRRAPISRAIYKEMGGGSPILANTVKQADALDEMLNSSQMGLGTVKTFVTMRYWHPMTSEIGEQVKAWNPDRIILLPLYPQYSRATTGSSVRVWKQVCEEVSLDKPTWTICCYPEDTGFIDAVASLTQEGLEKAKAESSKPIRVLFSAHGLPVRNIKKGDPYQMQIERTVAAAANQLNLADSDYVVCYQSRVGPLKWIGPTTDDEIERAGKDGCSIVLVPVAFVSEHSETLVELDIEYKELADEAGVETYVRVPTVDARASFVNGLAEQVRRIYDGEPRISPPNGKRYCEGKWGRCPCSVDAAGNPVESAGVG